MINELYQLAKALENAEIKTQSWYRKYIPIPNIRKNAPCIRITLSDGKVKSLDTVNGDLGKILRKYGSNQGTYPCMNLAPLYRITDKQIIKSLNELKNHPEKLDDEKLSQIKSWCQSNNWSKKFLKKYRISLQTVPNELSGMNLGYPPLDLLLRKTLIYAESPSVLREQIENVVFEMLSRKENVSLALNILFYPYKEESSKRKNKSKPNDDFGSLSVAFECDELIKNGTPAISERFVKEFNKYLLSVDYDEKISDEVSKQDAFGIPFHAVEEPMPSVKLAGGFDVTLRTMFKEQHCQARYGRTENASYPISPSMREKLQSALDWLGREEHRDITWINTDKNKILFAYPYAFPKQNISFTRMFKQPEQRNGNFEEQAKYFISELKQAKIPDTDRHSDNIHIFILRKIDKARTKIVYTRQTDPRELEKCSEEWSVGCTKNLPDFELGKPETPFPSDVAAVLNRFWKQNGELTTDKFKSVPKYHGIELLLEPTMPVKADLRLLSNQAMTLGASLSSPSMIKNYDHAIWQNVKDILVLLGFFLYREKIRKENYMENLPYLYGQLLKVSDELHAFYCSVVRNGDFPPRFLGGDLFQSAAEAPVRTLNVLAQRLMPYYAWAKSYRFKNCNENGKESRRAAWLIGMYENIMTKIGGNQINSTRFTDEEKAQLFIGYLASFPKKEKAECNKEEDNE